MDLVAHAVVEGTSGYAQQIQIRQHHLTADEPVSRGGTDTGPAPYALLMASLGACTSITLRMYGDRKGWKLGTIKIDLKLGRDGEAERAERVLHFSEPLDAEQKAKLLEIAGKTPVTKTLLRSFPIATTIGS
ncbi:MAG: OsmC family protein [Deltaproteobacteria bacterium]|nr:OsmC family protein [Deltaproteobacteria bacterium]